jgi:hypothetical protein
MFEETVNFCACEARPPIMVENVPAYVCERCGEQTFTDATTEAFESIKAGQVGFRTEPLRVCDFRNSVTPRQTAGELRQSLVDGSFAEDPNSLNDSGTAGVEVPVYR